MDAALYSLITHALAVGTIAFLVLRRWGYSDFFEALRADRWRHARQAIPPAAVAAAAVGLTLLLSDIPVYDCGWGTDVPPRPSGLAYASLVALGATIGTAVVSWATALAAAPLRNAPQDTKRRFALLWCTTTGWMASRLAWALFPLGIYALVVYPDLASAC